jgi:hypothetical protein
MTLPKLNLRDLFWLVVVVAMVIVGIAIGSRRQEAGSMNRETGAMRREVAQPRADTYGNDVAEVATLVAAYVRVWERDGQWPSTPYQSENLIFKGTESSDKNFPGRRRDFYRVLHDGGRELDVILWDDGRMK